MDNSPTLKCEARQKHELHNRKSICLSGLTSKYTLSLCISIKKLQLLIITPGSALQVAKSGFLASILTLLLILGLTDLARPTDAQLPSIPYLPNENDTFGTGGEPGLSSDFSSPHQNIPPPTVQITSLQDGQQVPVGELIVEGISLDYAESDCQVYADVNDIIPMRSVTPTGKSPGGDDFSKWMFTYSQLYQTIKEGANELTAKISCYAPSNPTPLSEWHTVNITGVVPGQPITSPAEGEPIIDGGEDEEEDVDQLVDEEEEEEEIT